MKLINDEVMDKNKMADIGQLYSITILSVFLPNCFRNNRM